MSLNLLINPLGTLAIASPHRINTATLSGELLRVG